MSNTTKIKEMLELQDMLNTKTNGVDWRSGVTKEGRVIDWKRCMYMEAAELIDSFNWKHWKDINAEDDMDNAKVELVDIWHFLMSYLLENNSLADVEHLIESSNSFDVSIVENKDIVNLVEIFIATIFCHNGKQDELLLNAFFNILAKMDMDIDELHEMYLVKNVLNIFRQDHGYKDGIYVKVFGGLEDNVIMFELANRLRNENRLDYTTLYSEYEKLYIQETSK